MTRASNSNHSSSQPDWAEASDDELLEIRIRDLKLEIPGTELESFLETFYKELDDRNIVFKPLFFLGDEWFCPDGSTSIAIPFYLAHPRLKKLEAKMMMEVEGGTRSWFMRLLRHEMGHVMNHAYLLERSPGWRKVFGHPSSDYSEYYRAQPFSKRFVQHLDDWYAQSHPEEDFSETFAIWLTPGMDWEHQYKGWKALEKLNYVNRLMKKLSGKPPRVMSRVKMSEASRLKSRLKTYYQRRRRFYAEDFPDFFDSDLKRLFVVASGDFTSERAGAFLRRNRKTILNAVSTWTGEPKFTINRVIRSLVERCDELDLKLGKDPSLTSLEITAYLASLASHYRLTGKFKKT